MATEEARWIRRQMGCKGEDGLLRWTMNSQEEIRWLRQKKEEKDGWIRRKMSCDG